MLTPPTQSKTALRNLLVVLAIAVGFIIYSYGWTVTDIDLEKPLETPRQEGVSRALRELLSPNLFDQDTETDIYAAPFRYGCEGEGVPSANVASEDGSAVLVVEATCGQPNDRFAFTISGLPPNSRAAVRWVTASGETRPREVFDTEDSNDGRTQFFVGANGSFSGYIEAPRIVGVDGETHSVELGVVIPVGTPYPSDTLNEVLRRMVETIFMALIATTISIPISVAISFFAAHNLMKPIKMPLGSAMLWAAVLPLGYLFGAWLLGDIGRLAFNLASGEGFTTLPAALTVGVLMGTAAAAQMTPLGDSMNGRVRQILVRVGVMVATVLVIGVIGGLGLTGERGLTSLADIIAPGDDFNLIAWALDSVGRMLGILGGIVSLALPMVAGLTGALVLPGLVNDLAKPVLRTATGALNAGLGAALGAISGAFAMAAVASIANVAALLTLLPPLVAALLGRAAVAGALNRLFPPKPAYLTTFATRQLRSLAALGGAVIGFMLAFTALNVGVSIIDGTLPPLETTNVLGVLIPTYTLTAMLIGALLGALVGGFTGVRGTFAVGDLLYNITRNVLNALRSIEPLIMALIFVVWVGIGPFAGVLALTLHSIASLGKLYSEQIETIDHGPIEALQSTGANHLQTIIYAVVPQIVPPYIAFTMYRWDINVRMSTIIGFVGGGGIGLLLNQYINLLRYSDAGVAVLAIAIVVSILDYASASIRERIL